MVIDDADYRLVEENDNISITHDGGKCVVGHSL